MIKKTFSTLKKNPLIILLLAIPAVWNLSMTLLIRFDILPSAQLMDYIGRSSLKPTSLMYLTWALGAVYIIGLMIFLNPPINYLVYGASADKVEKGWYRKGLGYWWRPFVMGLIFGITIFAISLPVMLILFFVISTFNVSISDLTKLIPIEILNIFILPFLATATAAIFAEKSFSDALGHIFKAGRRHYWKILFMGIIISIPFIIEYYILTSAGVSWDIFMSIFSWLTGAFELVFVMHCYLEYKNYLAQKEELLQDESNGIIIEEEET